MMPFARFVTRKMLTTIAAVAALTAVVAAFAVAGAAARGDQPDTVDVTPQALRAALDDPDSLDLDVDDTGGDWKKLRADLQAARDLEGDARRDAFAEIRSQAQDGDYGPGIERRADRREVRHELVLSLLPEDLRADLTELREAPADEREDLRAGIVDKALAGDYGPEVQQAAEKLRQLRNG